MKKTIFLALFLCLSSTSLLSQTNTFPTSGNVGIGTLSPSGILDIRNVNLTHLKGLNLELTGSTGAVIDQTYGIRVVNNLGGGLNGPSRYGGYFETISYPSSNNYNYGVVGVGHKKGGYGYEAIGVLGIAKHTYHLYATSNTKLFGVRSRIEFTDDGTAHTNTTFGAGFYADAIIPNNKTLTDYYGLYLKTPSGNVTNRWGIFQQDAVAKNYFAGQVGIGTTSPSSILHVSKNHGTQGVPMVNLSSTGDGDVLYVKNNSNRSDMYIANFQNNGGSVMGIRANGNVGIGTSSPDGILDIRNVNLTHLKGLNIELNGTTGFVVDETYGIRVINNLGGSENNPSRYGGYFEAIGYISSNNYNYGVVGIANKKGGYGYESIGILGVARHTYESFSSSTTNLIGVKGLVDFTDDGNSHSNSGLAASLYSEVLVPSNKTLLDYYGLYLKTPSGTITNKWGVFQEDENSKNYLNGSVGIGTTTPSHKLDVNGTTRIRSSNDAPLKVIGTDEWSGIDFSDIDGRNFIWYRGSSNTFAIGGGGSSHNGMLHIDGGTTIGANLDGISPPTDGLLVTGNMGIGITSPSEKLEVNGTIRTKRVKVEATGWPDYVFEPGYELLSLPETEAFIKTHKHLPEVPSAQEIEEKGQDLGAVQTVLLKKIEEMTLQMIEMNKRLEKLEAENKALKGKEK